MRNLLRRILNKVRYGVFVPHLSDWDRNGCVYDAVIASNVNRPSEIDREPMI
jgi:hypothetical protein